MRLKSLVLRNFRSFIDSTVVFPEKGLVLVKGLDLETGESSGTGKSAVFLGIAYALGILPTSFSGKDLQNWDTENEIQVVLTLDHNGKDVVIMRGKKNCVVVEGEWKSEGAKTMPESIVKLFGTSPDTLGALTYRPQGETGFFLAMGPSDKTVFLNHLLGLQSIENAIKVAQDKASKLTVELERARSTELPSALDRLSRLAKDLSLLDTLTDDEAAVLLNIYVEQEKLVASRQSAFEESKRHLEHLLSVATDERKEDIVSKKLEIGKVTHFITDLKAQDKLRQQAIANHAKQVAEKQRAHSVRLASVKSDRNKLAEMEKQVLVLESGSCYTCSRPWPNLTAKTEFMRDEIAVLKDSIPTEEALLEESRQVNELEVLQFVPDPKIEKLSDIYSRLSAELNLAQAVPETKEIQDQRAIVGQCMEELYTARESLSRSSAHISKLKSGKESEVRLRREIEISEKEIKDLNTRIDSLQSELNAEKDFEAMMGRGGFMGLIVEEVLSEIANATNVRLQNLANVNQVSLSFTTETENGRKQIQAWVDVRGHRTKLKTGLSGGMQVSLSQTVDLALMDVIGRRTGKMPGWICLDEIFDGQGRVTKEAALEVLQQVAQERLVLVIDHDAMVQEAFTQTINIEFSGGISKVVS